MKVAVVTREEVNAIENDIKKEYKQSYFGDSYNSTLSKGGLLIINVDKLNRVFPGISIKDVYKGTVKNKIVNFKDVIKEETEITAYKTPK